MNLREVTIGRSKNCDIFLDSRCQYASNMHATIYYDGNQLMFRDTSTNGTMINNVSVHKRAVPINRGDIIMIAGKYQINWNQIDSFFPASFPKPQLGTILDPNMVALQQINVLQPNLSKWNWGAFYLGWIWGLFNGCWWILLVNIVLCLFMMIPVVGLWISSITFLGWAVICGIKGTQWAWNNRTWNSVQEFEQTQSTWNKAAFSVFLCFIFLSLFYWVLLILLLIDPELQ